jgi:O-methyltransferase
VTLRERVGALLGRGVPAPPPPPPRPDFPPDFDNHDIAEHLAVAERTMTSPERIYALRNAVRYVHRTRLPGAIVECGVWKGGSMMAVARTLLELGVGDRELYLFDTFEGMSEPTDKDKMYTGQQAAVLLEGRAKEERLWGYVPLDDVRAAVLGVGYDAQRIHFVKGKVEDTVPDAAPEQIALLRLDTDWYESTLHELVHLYPRLAPGGVLIIDDYGHWQGARQAVDEYVAEHDIPLLLNRVDYTARIAIKP